MWRIYLHSPDPGTQKSSVTAAAWMDAWMHAQTFQAGGTASAEVQKRKNMDHEQE